MNCGEIKELLSEYVDDVLDAETKSFVDEHLSTCKVCQQELTSLKALVSELGSLEAVEPPKDFLGQLRERMEERSWFSKVLGTLFVPTRVKIPLEFAGAVAVAILVFSILHIQKDQLKLAEAPVRLEQERATEKVAMEDSLAEAPVSFKEERVAEKGAVETSGKAAKKEAYQPQLAYKSATAEPPREEMVPIELALVMKEELRPEAYAPGAAMEAAPAPKKKMRRSFALRETAPRAQLERDEKADDSLQKLTRLIEFVGGKVVSIEYEKETNRPESIYAEISAKQLNTLYNELKELGDLQTVPKVPTGKEQEILPVRIRLLSPK